MSKCVSESVIHQLIGRLMYLYVVANAPLRHLLHRDENKLLLSSVITRVQNALRQWQKALFQGGMEMVLAAPESLLLISFCCG